MRSLNRAIKRRRAVLYWVACDCQECKAETGLPFMCLSFGHRTIQAAKRDIDNYSKAHQNCFVAREITEAV